MGELIIRDGQDGTIGATTDAAVTSDAAGTLSAKLRGIVTILANVWDAVNGRIKVDSSVAKPDIVSGEISAVNGAVVCTLGNAKGVTFGTTGTYLSVTLAFEASHNGTNWYAIFAQRQDTIAASTTSLLIGTANLCFFADVNGFRFFRVRVSAIASGTVMIWIAPTDAISIPTNPFSTVTISGTPNMQAYNSASTTYGYASYHVKISAASTNATSVKAAAAQVGSIILANSHATAWRYAKFYNKSSAPTVGTDVPLMIIAIPPQDTITIHNQAGLRFITGLAYAITALPAITDTTAIGADEVIVNLIYL